MSSQDLASDLILIIGLPPEVYRRPKASAEAEGFQSLATASAAEGSSPNLRPLVKPYIFVSIISKDESTLFEIDDIMNP